MSGCTYTSICPECEEETLLCSSETRPHDMVDGYCINCGFGYCTIENRLTKKELKEEQKERRYNPKTKKFE